MHADAADGTGLAHFCTIRAPMDINVAAHGIHLTHTVKARFTARKPENAGENPVAAWISRTQFRCIDFAGGPASDKYCVDRLARPDFGANDVLAKRCANTAVLLLYPIPAPSSARIFPVTCIWWLSRISAGRSITLPHAPVLRSAAP